ncbi:MAG TPA: hypothetical protein VMZ29_06090 [Candidatus Bathyarchaeia archaeon]|nr:hypothetical protein [Candidatus Bathyarchaeia archaeon]
MTGNKQYKISKSIIFIFVFALFFSMNFVQSITNNNSASKLDTNKMVLKPNVRHEEYTLVEGQTVTFSYNSITVYLEHFFNFSVPDYSNGTINVESEQFDDYNPGFVLGELGIGESFTENCTFVGTYTQGDRIQYYEIEFTLSTGQNATIIFTHIIWDYYVYQLGIGGIIGFSVAGVAIITLIILYLKPKRKEYVNI